MKNRVRQLLLAAALVIIAQGAWAQTKPWYVAAGLGASFVNDVDIYRLDGGVPHYRGFGYRYRWHRRIREELRQLPSRR